MTATKAILVVDDSRPVCELIDSILAQLGYRVLIATDAAQALQLARDTGRIDLLLCDVEMCGMRGDEVVSRFSKVHPEAAVVFVLSSDGPISTTRPVHVSGQAFLRCRTP